MKGASAKDPSWMPNSGGGKGATINSPGQSSVTGVKAPGSKMGIKGTRTTSSKR